VQILFCGVVFGAGAVAAEYFPAAGTEALEYGLALTGAQLGVGVHRGHENGRVLIVLTLLGGHALYVHIYIAGECNVVSVVNEHDLSGEMSAASLVYLKFEITKAEEARLTYHALLGIAVRPGYSDLAGIAGGVLGECFAHLDIRLVRPA